MEITLTQNEQTLKERLEGFQMNSLYLYRDFLMGDRISSKQKGSNLYTFFTDIVEEAMVDPSLLETVYEIHRGYKTLMRNLHDSEFNSTFAKEDLIYLMHEVHKLTNKVNN